MTSLTIGDRAPVKATSCEPSFGGDTKPSPRKKSIYGPEFRRCLHIILESQPNWPREVQLEQARKMFNRQPGRTFVSDWLRALRSSKDKDKTYIANRLAEAIILNLKGPISNRKDRELVMNLFRRHGSDLVRAGVVSVIRSVAKGEEIRNKLAILPSRVEALRWERIERHESANEVESE